VSTPRLSAVTHYVIVHKIMNLIKLQSVRYADTNWVDQGLIPENSIGKQVSIDTSEMGWGSIL
jgi:hypothetical protein